MWAVAIVVVLLVVAVRIRLLDTPFERDEGEYAYSGQLILEGIAPFRLAANMKLPGTDAMYALIMAVFGQSIAGVHFGALLVNLGAVAFVFLIARRFFGVSGGLAAGASYALLSVGTNVLGMEAHATHFVVLFALVGIWLLLRWNESRKLGELLLSGLLLGLAFLMKQPGIAFGIFGGLYTVWRQRGELRTKPGSVVRNVVLFGAVFAVPYLITCLILWRAGIFPRFWFWTVTYARAYSGVIPLSEAWGMFSEMFPPVIKTNTAIWLLALAGSILLWLRKEQRQTALFATVFLAISFAAVCPGFYFRQHYFILMLPALALLAGAAVGLTQQLFSPVAAVSGFAIVMLFSIMQQSNFLFQSTSALLPRQLYGVQPFPDAVIAGNYLREHAKPDARIAVLGSEPEIYFYARRHSATSYLYTYSLMEKQPYALQMQEEMIGDIEQVKPDYIVLVTAPFSWMRTPDSPSRIFDWWDQYAPAHYDVVGMIDILANNLTITKFDAEAPGYTAQTNNTIRIFKRRS